MKNLLRKFKLEDMIDKSPKELSYFHSKKYWDSWDSGRNYDHTVDNVWPWTRVRRIIENNIGKSFDLAFSYYCKQVPIYQQQFFLKEFQQAYRWIVDCYVDENGLIQKIKEKEERKPVIFYSDDYETELKHKVWDIPRDYYEQKEGHRYYSWYKTVLVFNKSHSLKSDKKYKYIPEHEAHYSDFHNENKL